MKDNEKTNVIHVTEDRSFVDKAKENMENIRQTYKEKMIDTGRSQELERMIDEDAERKKKVIKVVGTAATIALIFIPADGPFGEIATFFATPGLCLLTDLCADMKKKALITGKRSFEKSVLKVDGSNKDISGYDLSNPSEIIGDFESLKESMENIDRARSM